MRHWQQLQDETQAEQKTEDPSLGSIIYVAQPILNEGEVLGMLIVVHTTAGEIEEAIEAIVVMVQDLLIVLGFALLCAWMISGKILSPLRSLTITARKISESDLSQRITVEGNGELAELATTFNDMMERLEKSFMAQRDLINDIGHELRTPITIIQGHTDFHGTLRNQRFKRWSQHEIESRVLDGNPRNSSEISPWRPTKSVRYVFSS